MSTKIFCDGCGKELTTHNKCWNSLGSANPRIAAFGSQGKPAIEIITGITDFAAKKVLWNSGDWCKYCVIDAVNELDDRPRHA